MVMDPPSPSASSASAAGKKRHLLKQRFQVIKKLGQGTYGKVQLAINKESGQDVAIKTIRKSMVETEQDLVRIRREIQIMSSIQHPHIIHIYEVFENKDKIVLVMQFAPGGELYEYLSERKVFDDLEARRIFRQISSAIYYCHKNHICHRDLKLENILIDEKGNAKIADFGLSNVFDEKHYLSTFCGSPLYASPEIVKGTPYFGPEVDCWSLGVLLYTLVYGAMPFDGSNFRRLVKHISEASYYEPQNKSEASGLIRRLLTVDPKRRATIVDICSDDWVNSGFENSLLQVSEDLARLTPVRLDILLAPIEQHPVLPSNCEQPQSGKKKGTKLSAASPDISPSSTTSKRKKSAESSSKSTDSTSKSSEKESKSVQKVEPVDAASSYSAERKKERISPNRKNEDLMTDSTLSVTGSTTCPSTSSTITPTTVTPTTRKTSSTVSSTTSSTPSSTTNTAGTKTQQAQKTQQQAQKIQQPQKTQQQPQETRTSPPSAIKSNHKLSPTPSEAAPSIEDSVPATSQTKESASDLGVKTDTSYLEQGSDSSSQIPEKRQELETRQKPETRQEPETKQIPEKRQVSLERQVSLKSEEVSSIHSSNAPTRQASLDESIHESNPNALDDGSRRDSNEDGSRRDSNEDGSSRGRNPPLERRSSSVASRKVGRLSIPNFLELQERSPALKKPVPSYGISIDDAKKKLLQRKDSTASETKEVEHVFPTIPVAEVKQDVERRASTIDTPTLTKGPQGIRFNSITAEDEVIRGKKKVMERRSTEPLAMFKTEIKSIQLKGDQSQQPELQHSATSGGKMESSVREGGKMESSVREGGKMESSVREGGKMESLTREVLKKQLASKVRKGEHRRQSSEAGSGKESLQIPEAVSESPELVSSPSPTKIPEAVSESPELVSSPSPTKGDSDEISKQGRKQSIKLDTVDPHSQSLLQSSEGPFLKTVESPEGPFLKTDQGTASPASGSMPVVIKPAPITRSYKKVKFTKDGACITETGKVYSTQGPDGKITRVEKKSKVTHYPSTSEGKRAESTVTMTSSGERDGSPCVLEAAKSPLFLSEQPNESPSKNSIRKSESVSSSSGSTDIFDDIFDTWSGDTMFSDMMSPRLKTLLHPSMFNMKRSEDRGQRKAKSRAESCDRRDSTASTSLFDTTDEDPTSSTFAATSSPFILGGPMFKMGINPAQSLLDRHRSMFSDSFSNPSDSAFFSNNTNDNFFNLSSSPFSSRLGRERTASSASGTRSGRCEAYSRSRPSSLIRDSFDDSNSGEVTTPRSSISFAAKTVPPFTTPFIRSVSNSSASDGTSSDTIKPDDCDESEDSVASRKRVEQWLHMSPTDQLVMGDNPYATIRRPQSRYARTMSSRLSQGLSDDVASDDFDDFGARFKTQRRPVGVQMRVNLGGQNPRSRQVYKPSYVYNDPRLNSQMEEPVTVPEASTLLQQLQMHGYKNLVNQQILFGPEPKRYDDGPLAGQPYRKETVKERIHRKSYYSRFNDEPIRRSSSLTPQIYDWPNFRQSQ